MPENSQIVRLAARGLDIRVAEMMARMAKLAGLQGWDIYLDEALRAGGQLPGVGAAAAHSCGIQPCWRLFVSR